MLHRTPQARRIPLSRRSHIIGFQWTQSGATPHESALERDFVTLTSFMDAAVIIQAQPVMIFYEDQGCRRRYTPDYLVKTADLAELVEVKYESDLKENWRRLAPAFSAAEQWAQAHAAKFRIATEAHIRGQFLENAKRLLPLRALHLDAKAAMRVLTLANYLERPTIETLLSMQPHRSLALQTLWRLLARGTLRTDLSVPVTLNSVLWANE